MVAVMYAIPNINWTPGMEEEGGRGGREPEPSLTLTPTYARR